MRLNRRSVHRRRRGTNRIGIAATSTVRPTVDVGVEVRNGFALNLSVPLFTTVGATGALGAGSPGEAFVPEASPSEASL
jgi:hypothetical protein